VMNAAVLDVVHEREHGHLDAIGDIVLARGSSRERHVRRVNNAFQEIPSLFTDTTIHVN
jgi:hypothetical protein